ncbi:MAG: LacI family transcriptional regulator [Pseudonocardiales bacterium]|nr:LacI family transcriptional regulator [Pseudonocardiales bacterium]
MAAALDSRLTHSGNEPTFCGTGYGTGSNQISGGLVAVTMSDIARLAGVSKTTVSRVLNDKPDVDEVTAARVRRLMAEHGYTPSARAVGLARGQTRTVGMLVPSLSWPWMSDVLQGAVDVLEVEGYGLLLYTTTRGEESLAQFAAHVSSSSFDGLLVIEPPNTMDYIASLYESGLPVVLIDDRGHHPEFPSVGTTNAAGGEQAAAHLVASGRCRLAMITGPREYGCTTDRSKGFRDEARRAHAAVARNAVVEGDFTEQGGYDAMSRLLRVGEFDGLFAHNDLMAIGAMRALRAAGRSVPADVAVVGFDDIPTAAHTEPPLTTVRQPSREMASTAAHTLLAQLGGNPAATETQILPTSLVVRGSAPETTTDGVRRRGRRTTA